MDIQISIYKIDKKFNKKNFFANSIVLFLIQFFTFAVYTILYSIMDKIYIPLALFVGFLLLLPILYFNFVVTTKRIWDIIGGKYLSILLTVILFLILGICIYIFPFAFFIVYFLLLFLPGCKIEE